MYTVYICYFSLCNPDSLLVDHMETKAAKCSKEKVLVTVYVEKPRRNASSNNRRESHSIKQEFIQRKLYEGYNRRAELLRYSQRLREMARSPATESKPLLVKSIDSSSDQQKSNKIVDVQRKTKYSKTSPGCFDNWGSCFVRSLMKPGKMEKPVGTSSASSNSDNMKSVMKNLQLQMQKKWKYLSKPIFILNKHR